MFNRSLGVALFAGVAALTQSLAFPSEADVTKLNTKIDMLAIRDSAGKPVRLPEAKATVIVFVSFECPVSNSYAAPLSDLAKAFGPQGVTFVGLCPCDLSAADVEKQAKEFHLG